MPRPNEDTGNVSTSAEVQRSISLLSHGTSSFTAQCPMLVSETLSPVPSVPSNGAAGLQHDAVADRTHVSNASAAALLSTVSALPDVRATETRLRTAQEAELSVLVRLRRLTETLVSVISASNAAGGAGVVTTAAHGGCDTEDVKALSNEGAFRASLPVLIACPSAAGINGATHIQAETCLVMRCVSMPPAGLSAAAREQYTALHDTLAQYLCKSEDGSIDSACDIAASNACSPSTGTLQDPQSVEQCDAILCALGPRVTRAVICRAGTPTALPGVAEGEAGTSTQPVARDSNAVEVHRHSGFFSEPRHCILSPPRRSVSARRWRATGVLCDPEVSAAGTGMGSGSASWGTGVSHSPLTPSHVYGSSGGLVGKGESSTAMAMVLPKFSPVWVEGSSAELAADEERAEIRVEEDDHSGEKVNGTALASPTPITSAGSAATSTRGPSPYVVMVKPCSPLYPCISPLAAHRVATVNAWEDSSQVALGGHLAQDTPTSPPPLPTLRSSPHQLSQPLSATPTSTLGDADEEGMYFPTPPTAKTHRRIESDIDVPSRLPAMGNSGRAYTGAHEASAFPITCGSTVPAASLRRLALGGGYDEAGSEPPRVPQWETPMVDTSREGVLQTVSAAHTSLLSSTPTGVVTATDILATITALPPPSSRSLLSKRTPARRTHRGGKGTGATRKANVARAEGRPIHCGARKRTRGEVDEWGRIDVADEPLAAVPMAGLPSLSADVSLSTAAVLNRLMCEEADSGQHSSSAPARRAESDGHQHTVLEGEHASCGYVRTREQRMEGVAQAEQVFSAVRAACRPLLSVSLQTPPRGSGANAERDDISPSLSPPLSQNTPRQFWDIDFP
ncbi:conserved hypothetical protein [Leishmania braziliensis MHOM/BR/75/M2904]|uniref:Uncharacterized protein n=1 Tax=Leishmania braziliensis TaxID=5660 RepID=A4HF80_LEIBR|nr:conserved hypothetical protein [Leishmania braziliensis MHOM/BR/75/M2904]CAJ2474926.1 unnamed protein product [Leishmania braziliensis]CAM39490.1 conserved hypothetical protein [Leishmania braziliensis MHOM/BR/75/M2904]